jgi:hypothetical protein
MPDVILAVLVFAPLAVTFSLKTNAALGFFSLCASFVVISFTNIDVKDLTKNLSFQLTSSTFDLIILIAPFVLTLLLNRKSFSGQLKSILHYATALCSGALLALIAIPLLNESARLNFANSWGWNNLQKIQTAVVIAGAVLSLVLIWFSKTHVPVKKHK